MTMKSGLSRTLKVEKQQIERLNDLLSLRNPDYNKHGIWSNCTIWSMTADFGEGIEMDVKVCSADPDEPLWAEAVLFDRGHQLTFTPEVRDKIDGEWSLEWDDMTYTTIIEEE